MKEKKRDPRLSDHVSCRISAEKYKHLQRQLTNGLFYLQYDVANFIFLLKYRQQKVDLNEGGKSVVFVTKRHLYAQLSNTKISYLRKNTYLRKDSAFLHFRLETYEN